MKIRLFSLISFLAAAIAVSAQGNFVSVGGSAAQCVFAVENAVSGYATSADGSIVVSHGAMPLSTIATAGVDNISIEQSDGPISIYTLDGRKVSADIENLEPGVYVICQGTKIYKHIQSPR